MRPEGSWRFCQTLASPDAEADGAYRGDQSLLVAVTSGQYRGQTLLTSNAVGPLYGEPAASGDHVTLLISTYADGSHNATVYEHDRSIAIGLILAAFLLVTVLVGGKTGAKSILGLAMTVAVLVLLLIPPASEGVAHGVDGVFLLCSYIAVVCFVILGGVNRKILCACLGTIAGMALATVFDWARRLWPMSTAYAFPTWSRCCSSVRRERPLACAACWWVELSFRLWAP